MKYIAVIDTDDYKNFKFYEDANGKYLVARDANAEPDEWIALHFIKAESEEYSEIKNKMSDDVISRQAVLEKAISVPIAKVVPEDEVICRKVVFVDDIENLPPVTPQQKMGHCKDCKYFEYDYVANVDGIPLILAHEFCKRWGDGCKTREDGYCFLYEPRESEEQ